MKTTAVFFLLILTACQPQRTSKTYTSPDGGSRLEIQASDKGGCCSISYAATLHIGDYSKKVFSGRGGALLAAKWINPDKVLILADDIDSYELKSFNYRPNVNKPDGSPDGIRIILIDKKGN